MGGFPVGKLTTRRPRLEVPESTEILKYSACSGSLAPGGAGGKNPCPLHQIANEKMSPRARFSPSSKFVLANNVDPVQNKFQGQIFARTDGLQTPGAQNRQHHASLSPG